MKKVETLLNIEFGQKFATPKKLNRSTKNIPENVLQQLKEMLFQGFMQQLKMKAAIYVQL